LLTKIILKIYGYDLKIDLNEGKKERRKIGRKEGRKEGSKEGRKEGRKEGIKTYNVTISPFFECLTLPLSDETFPIVICYL